VGNGEEMEPMQERVKDRGLEDNVIFHGAIYDDVRNGEMLFASDLMLMPGYVGLSVNHALNFDCPVVTFKQKEDGPFHSPEIEYLVDGETGFVVEEHTAGALAETVDGYLSDETLAARMQVNIRQMIEKTCSIENFIKGFKEASDYVLTNKQRKNVK
jgi:glycosyltransferase involved in cell wall biosynthesis